MDLTCLTYEILFFLFLIALLAGFLDTLAGGGGLLTIPALMLSGMGPLAALATNKFQCTFGTATASLMLLRQKRICWHNVKFLMLTAFIGSAIGTLIVQFINAEVLNFVIPIVILLIGVYFLISPSSLNEQRQARISKAHYRRYVMPLIGCYDGMFGPATGSFFTLAGRTLQGLPFLEATATAKALNFATNIASLTVFLFAGQIVWLAGACMLLGQLFGAWLGAHCLYKIPVNVIRYLVVLMCFAMLIKFLVTL